MGWLGTLIVGLIAGLIASRIMKANTGVLMDLVLGVAGAFVGGLIAQLLTRSSTFGRHQHMEYPGRFGWFSFDHLGLPPDQAQITVHRKKLTNPGVTPPGIFYPDLLLHPTTFSISRYIPIFKPVDAHRHIFSINVFKNRDEQ